MYNRIEFTSVSNVTLAFTYRISGKLVNILFFNLCSVHRPFPRFVPFPYTSFNMYRQFIFHTHHLQRVFDGTPTFIGGTAILSTNDQVCSEFNLCQLRDTYILHLGKKKKKKSIFFTHEFFWFCTYGNRCTRCMVYCYWPCCG